MFHNILSPHFVLLYKSSRRVTRGVEGGGGEVSPALFQKSALILEKNGLIVSILGLISHFKCDFKSFQENKNYIFSLRSVSFMCCRWNVYRRTLIPRKLPCPEKFLVTHLGSHRRCSIRKGVLRNFAKLTGKHLCQNLFFASLAWDSDTGVFLLIL